MQWQTLSLEWQQQLAIVSLNRPDKLNAINYTMFSELKAMARHLHRQRHLRAVILRGEGGQFSSGLDIKSVANSPWQALKLLFKLLPGNANLAQQVSVTWRELPVPVIAVLDGRCYGGGLQIALGADFRIAANDAELSIMEAKWGLVPDMGGLVSLREILAKDQALKLSMTAELIPASKALDLGLVTECCSDPLARAKELAAELNERSPDALAAIKLSINRSWNGSRRRLLARESWSQVRLLLGRNRAIAAVRQGKDPERAFEPRRNW
ncbi:crotonase/enoyl-CoA hydratase family protein [Shewanella algae]|uniref:crotonase/enoyl-CoA hydratase family protein n=1 Tax=Shewanella algae TaxID=38313 RepID=UPI0031F58D84